MSDDAVTKLLAAIEIAAFRRGADGSFAAIAPPPRWFQRLVADTTFPFLGHILEEATEFWQSGTPGSREWGPSAEVDELGREFHYRVIAVSVDESRFLLFQRDPGSDQMREVLQKVREQALVDPAAGSAATLSKVQQQVRQASERVHDVLRPLLATGRRDPQFELWTTLTAACEELVSSVDALIGQPRSSGGVSPATRKP